MTAEDFNSKSSTTVLTNQFQANYNFWNAKSQKKQAVIKTSHNGNWNSKLVTSKVNNIVKPKNDPFTKNPKPTPMQKLRTPPPKPRTYTLHTILTQKLLPLP